MNWSNSRSQRIGVPNILSTPNAIGPGSYNTLQQMKREIMNPTIPRTGLGRNAKSFSRNTSATIKNNYEDDENDEEVAFSPGPGSYRTEVSSFRIQKQRPNSLQLFGSNQSRFNEKPLGSALGPG